jgi:hypothetical protein
VTQILEFHAEMLGGKVEGAYQIITNTPRPPSQVIIMNPDLQAVGADVNCFTAFIATSAAPAII